MGYEERLCATKPLLAMSCPEDKFSQGTPHIYSSILLYLCLHQFLVEDGAKIFQLRESVQFNAPDKALFFDQNVMK